MGVERKRAVFFDQWLGFQYEFEMMMPLPVDAIHLRVVGCTDIVVSECPKSILIYGIGKPVMIRQMVQVFVLRLICKIAFFV